MSRYAIIVDGIVTESFDTKPEQSPSDPAQTLVEIPDEVGLGFRKTASGWVSANAFKPVVPQIVVPDWVNNPESLVSAEAAPQA